MVSAVGLKNCSKYLKTRSVDKFHEKRRIIIELSENAIILARK